MTNTKHNIKRGVSLYSYQEEVFLRKMTLEDCIATSAGFGAKGIEIIPEQSIPGFPKLTDAFIAQWRGWMDKYGTTPTCHDMFLDIKRVPGRMLTEDEMVESVVRDLKYANALGLTVMRCIVNTPVEILAKCVPFAEQYGVKLCIEIHSPWHVDHPWMMRMYDMFQKFGPSHLGFIPDMGIFIKRYPRVVRDRFLRQGADEKLVAYVCEAYENGVLSEYIIGNVYAMGGKPIDMQMAEQARHLVWSNPRRLLEIMPYVHHIHAKFLEMQDDYTEYSIPYDQVIAVLIEGGYSGYLSSEYEGNRHIQDISPVDSVEQVRRQQVMFKRLLGEE